MLETHEYMGVWWLPGQTENESLTGTVSVVAGKTELEVMGSFGRELLSETARSRQYSLSLEDKARVLGISTDGKKVTLEDLSERGSTVNLPGIETARYGAAAALVGKHFSAEEDVAFDEVAIRASDLNAWTQTTGFSFSFELEELEGQNGNALVGTEVRYAAPEEIHIPLARGEEVFIRFNAPSKGIGPGSDHVEISQEAALHLRFAKRADLRTVFRRVGELRNFLSLAVGRPVSVLSVTGYQDDFTRGQTTFPQPIEIYWEMPNNSEPPTKSRHSTEMLFTLKEAHPEISTVMKRWFQRQSRLEPVFNLFFGTLFHPSLYLEVRFLAYAQAIETYDYRRRRRLGRKHLAERMRDVLAQCRTVSKRIVGAEDGELDEFIARFKDARNYYTHYNPRLEKKAAKGAALLLLTIQLQAILEMSLLRELGFSVRQVDAILERIRRYAEIDHFRSQAAQETEGGISS